MSYIYIVTNKINGMQYVGQHKYSGDGLDASYDGSGVYLNRAYNKYGKENFTMELLEECTDKELNTLEQKYIAKYNTLNPNGYNLTLGGDGHLGYTVSDETKYKISNSLKGFQFTDERRKNISKALIGNTPWNKGKKGVYSEETKEKLSKSHINNEVVSKAVAQISSDGTIIATFPSASEAGRSIGTSKSHIIECCNGKRQKAGGFQWKYTE